jgi:hypothetical protein
VADQTKVDDKKSNLLAQIVTSVAIAILVGGTSPWWFNAFFSKPATKPTPPDATLNRQDPTPVASRDFCVGRWRVDQAMGSFSGGTVVDYLSDGRFEGEGTQFVGNQGQKASLSGTWEFEQLSNQTFRLRVRFGDVLQLFWVAGW